MSRTKTYEALLVLSTALLLLYLYGWIRFEESRIVYLYLSAGIGLSGIVVRPLGTLIAKGWYLIADLLGRVMSKVLMAVIFIIVLIPVATLYRLTKKDGLQLKRNSGSTWKKRDHPYSSKDLKNIW